MQRCDYQSTKYMNKLFSKEKRKSELERKECMREEEYDIKNETVVKNGEKNETEEK